jgi:SpoVK/Ycf46/Vps4 family AAA+-type ATPase
MNKQVSRVWTFASDSNPNIEYETLQYLDGSASCNCKGWTRRVPADGTANDVSQLPPEMLRKGRFDELFFVDLPNQTEREAIWEIQIGKHGRDPRDLDVVQLAKATEGLTGSEIENVFIEALYLAFDGEKEPTDLDICQVLIEFVPLSKLMAEQIGGLRNWSKGRARLATSLVSERGLRKLAM